MNTPIIKIAKISHMGFNTSCLKFGIVLTLSEPRREKTGLRGFRPGPTQTGLYKLRKELEA